MPKCTVCSHDLPKKKDQYVTCLGGCNALLHFECSTLSEKTYAAMSSSKKEEWRCSLCRAKTSSSTMSKPVDQSLSNQLDVSDILKYLVSIDKKLDVLSNDSISVRNAVTVVSEKCEKIVPLVSKLESKLSKIEGQVQIAINAGAEMKCQLVSDQAHIHEPTLSKISALCDISTDMQSGLNHLQSETSQLQDTVSKQSKDLQEISNTISLLTVQSDRLKQHFLNSKLSEEQLPLSKNIAVTKQKQNVNISSSHLKKKSFVVSNKMIIPGHVSLDNGNTHTNGSAGIDIDNGSLFKTYSSAVKLDDQSDTKSLQKSTSFVAASKQFKRTPVIGSGTSQVLQAAVSPAPKHKHKYKKLFVTRLAPYTSEADILNQVSLFSSLSVICYKIVTKSPRYSSFYLSVIESEVDIFMMPINWPQGVMIVAFRGRLNPNLISARAGSTNANNINAKNGVTYDVEQSSELGFLSRNELAESVLPLYMKPNENSSISFTESESNSGVYNHI